MAAAKQPTARQLERAARPASRRGRVALKITPAKRQRFLELVAEGKNRQEAAAAIGQTGSQMRAMVREGSSVYDQVFADAYAAAAAAGAVAVAEALAAEGLRRQLGGDPALMSDRGLHNERIFRDPDYRAAHRQAPTVNVTTEMEITHVHVEGAADGLRQKLAPVIDLRPAADAETGGR